MQITPNFYDDEQPDDSLNSELDSAIGIAVLEMEEGVPDDRADEDTAEWSGLRCEKCDAPMKSGTVTICRHCGWYASLGTFLEVDPDWETEIEPSKSPTPAPELSHIDVWIQLLPKWAWLIVASLFAVVIESILVRISTSEGSPFRTLWSLAQLAIGSVVFIGCHLLNFLGLVSNDTEVGVMDVLLKPIKLWVRGAHNLPERLWITNSAASGLMAVVMSVLVIGGLPYESLWDWGFKEPPKQNLMGAVMDRVKEIETEEDNKNLEDAVSDFAGSQNLDSDSQKPKPIKPRGKADCVILGYQLDLDGQLSALILGTANRRDLAYAGSVRPEFSAEESDELTERLSSIRAERPFIAIQKEGVVWVKPQYTCRVTFAEQQKSGRLTDLKWDKLLGLMRMN